MNIARTRQETQEKIYMLTVLVPGRDGYDQWDVECYGLRTRAECGERGQALVDLLQRIPTQDDGDTFRDLWLDLVKLGVTPARCRVELLSRTHAEDDAGDRGHGWNHERYYDPSA